MLNKQISEYFLDTVRVQNMVTEYAREQQLIGKSESEYEYLHFSKAFAEPIARMQREEVPFDMEIVEQLKKMLLWYFPDILENPYIKLDESREMEFYKEILSAG